MKLEQSKRIAEVETISKLLHYEYCYHPHKTRKFPRAKYSKDKN